MVDSLQERPKRPFHEVLRAGPVKTAPGVKVACSAENLSSIPRTTRGEDQHLEAVF
ncbi:hypothetical protein LEMLEM_LOCUS9717 [Lemmus lemmus]